MAELRVRRAGKADLPAVLALYAQPDFNGGRAVTLDEAERRLEKFALYPDYALYLAEQDGETVGTFSLIVIDNIAHWGMPVGMVESIVVSGRRQRRGIGRMIMREAAMLAEMAGCYKLVLSSDIRSDRAHAFYEALLFERYGYSFRLTPPMSRDAAAGDVAA